MAKKITTKTDGKVEGLEAKVDHLQKELESALTRNEELENLLAESEASRAALRERNVSKVNDEQILAAIEHAAKEYDPADSGLKKDKAFMREASHLFVQLRDLFADRKRAQEDEE